MKPKISIVIPAKNEEKSVTILAKEITSVLERLKKTYEIIFIDDGSTDNTLSDLTNICSNNKREKIIKLRGNWGKAVALKAGFEIAKGEIIITMDADLQDNPKEIPKFISKIEKGSDLVVGWKKKRNDPISKLIATKLFNTTVSLTTGLKVHDVNCGFKAYKKEVIENIIFSGDSFRLIPVIAAKQNYKVSEIVVAHRARKFGKSKYGLERSIKGVLDLLTVIFITGYLKKPGHFFGGLGLAFFSSGFGIGLYIAFLRITTGTIQFRQPLLYFGILLMTIGVQLITTGLLAEMILNLNQKEDKSERYIAEIIN